MVTGSTAVSVLRAALGLGTLVDEANAGEASVGAARAVSGGPQSTSGSRSRGRGRGRGSRAGVSVCATVTELGVAASAAVVNRSSTVAVLGAAVTEGRAKANLVPALSAAGAVSGDSAGRGGSRADSGRDASRRGRRSTGSGVTVPVGLGLVHALTHGDTPEATSLEGLNHGYGQVEGGELVNVVCNRKLALGGRVGSVDGVAEVVLSDLDPLTSELVVVIGVKIEVRNDISESLQDVLANSVARRVGRAHVGRVFANDVANGHLILDHLVVDLSLSDCGKILVGPGVGSDLVAVGDHTPDDSLPLLVDSTLADVVTGDEEGGLEASSGELVKNLVSVDVWAVVVGDGNGSSLATGVDTGTAVSDVALLRASIIASAGSSRGLVGVAARTKVEQAVRSIAVIPGVSTVSSARAAVTLSANSVAKTRSATVVGITTLTCEQVVRTLNSSGSSSTCSARRRSPDLDVARKAEELRGSLNTTVGGNEGSHRRGSKHLGETHYVGGESVI